MALQYLRHGGHHYTWPAGARLTVVVSIVAGGLLLDELTPQMVHVSIFYVGAVLTGFWFPKPTAALALALLATFLIVVAYWITTPDVGTVWELWTNRLLSIGTVWLTAVFVWYIRVLQEKLWRQIEVTNSLSREISHRVGNSLQIVASFVRLQARGSGDEKTRLILQKVSARVMAIGRVERILSHSGAGRVVDSRDFVVRLIDDVRSTLSDQDKVRIAVEADAAELTSSLAIALGACLIELINNALKHAFADGSPGKVDVRFLRSGGQFIFEVEDNGVGFKEAQAKEGSGARNVAELARLMRGEISHRPACGSATRPGTVWRLAIPGD